MPRHELSLPILQNWSCHNCSGCCRQHQIEITEEERARIEKQNWSDSGEIPADQPLFQTLGPKWNRRQALAHQPDGACVFLNEEGLCRIHAKFGEAAKPLACRIYPYAFHPAGKKVAVSLRFSCPSVVSNLGTPLKDNAGELKQIASLVVPEYARELAPPGINARERVDWKDFLQIVSALDDTLANEEAPIALKLCHAIGWLKLVESATFEKVKGSRLAEFLEMIQAAAGAELEAQLELPAREPSRTGRLLLRMLVAQYARKDTAAEAAAGWKGRFKLFKAYWRFAGGKGEVPAFQPEFGAVTFAEVEAISKDLPDAAEELLTRYFRVKVQGLHFCGRAFYDVPLVEGFYSLALMFPVVIWLARWLAAGEKRNHISNEDLSRALAIADHHHGYSPALGTRSARKRAQQLAQLDDIRRFCLWYAAEEFMAD